MSMNITSFNQNVQFRKESEPPDIYNSSFSADEKWLSATKAQWENAPPDCRKFLVYNLTLVPVVKKGNKQ
jgi:hypothetical protein